MGTAKSDTTVLEFDAGNTRIKWRLVTQAKNKAATVLGSGVVFAPQKSPAAFLELCKQFEGLPVETIGKVLVASVRGEGFKTAFSAFLSEKWQLQPEFVGVVPGVGLVQHRYQEPSKLGVDRWLAMQAAFAAQRRACVIVDVGTTVTVDVVDNAGVHVGGYIVPGLQLMKSALMQRSRALGEIPDQPWGATSPGLNTGDAIHHGVLAMVAGFVRDLHAQAGQGIIAPAAAWLLTGGDAAVLQPLLAWDTLLEPDLVMNGLRYCEGSS